MNCKNWSLSVSSKHTFHRMTSYVPYSTPNPWEYRRADSSPAFCHWLGLWWSTDSKLNTGLFISQRPSAKCAASSSLLTSSLRHDWFSNVFFSPGNYLPIHTFPYSRPHSPASDHPYTHSPPNKQEQQRHAQTHIQMQRGLGWNWNESTITVSIFI